ncbi:MAG: ribonuclease HII [Candidatus Paceibacterota bacterium]
MKNKYIVGIDEAGRGPLAGPVAVAAVVANLKSQISKIKILAGIKDSKKLSAKQREEWYRKIKSKKSNLKSFCVFISHKTIDKINIHQATLLGVKKVLKKFKRKPGLVLLDGSLHAPREYKQKTIIKGDEKISLISAASIIAKVSRDRKMTGLHKKYPKYHFDKHKGYGTKLHYKKIKKHGLLEIHRKSFCLPATPERSDGGRGKK